MKNLYSIGEAAKMANMTSETLRHYDRIGLVKPGKKDEWTNYRYYTRQDIVRLNTVHALTQMDLSLREIKEVLEYNDLAKIISFLEQAEKRADKKIAELQSGKARLRLARADYERKLHGQRTEQTMYTLKQPQRVIMLSESMETPTVDTLWNYLGRFYDRLAPDQRPLYEFEDLAGVYTENGASRLFAVCRRYGNAAELKILPEGLYLCADCTAENREAVRLKLIQTAKEQYQTDPPFVVQLVMISGILQWTYQIQVLIKET